MAKYKTLLIGLGVLLILVIWYVSTYNGLVTAQTDVEAKWDQVENMYQRRLDLIPNLVETVKGFAKQESSVLTQVTEMRARVGQMNVTKEVLDDPEAFKKFQNAQSELSSALSRLLAVQEAYPDLKSNQNFLALQSQLEGTENRIAVWRKRYIESVQDYNTRIRRMPTSLVASLAGFKEKASFDAAAGAEKAPEVKF